MALVSRITLVRLPERHCLSVRTRAHMENLPIAIGYAQSSIAAYLESEGLHAAGGTFLCYYNQDAHDLDIEIGIPTDRLYPGRDDVAGYTLPAKTYVTAIYQGAYKGSDPDMEAMADWALGKGHVPDGTRVYDFLNDESWPAAECLVRLLLPLVEEVD